MPQDNRQCEEWALLHGQCQSGSIRVTGYATSAARCSAITGGTYTVVARSGAVDEQGTHPAQRQGMRCGCALPRHLRLTDQLVRSEFGECVCLYALTLFAGPVYTPSRRHRGADARTC
jgi:hypothetical protein